MADKARKKIGIIFNFSDKWLGGVYYIINLVNSLNFLKDEEKPEIYLFYNKNLEGFLPEFNYDNIHKIETKFPSYLSGYLKSLLNQQNKFITDIISNYDLSGVYPLNDHPVSANKKAHKNVELVSWVADLQHKYYPGFFSKKVLLFREIRIKLILRNARHLVVSSKAVANDFRKFYHIKKDLQLHIYHFSSIIENFDFSNQSNLLEKYNLPERYFLVSNQFHNHKNHQVVFKALGQVIEKRPDIHIAITGKFPERSDSPYTLELHRLVEECNLKNNITFLGVIPRQDQLCLMRYCQAVIQPSLFEGWSTVIEDAISLQTPVIASNIDVNMEQLDDNGVFFNPLNNDELVELIKNYPDRTDFDKVIYEKYEDRVSRAAKSFISIFS